MKRLQRLLYCGIAVFAGSCAQHTPALGPTRFYDFNIEVTLLHSTGSLQQRFILANLRPDYAAQPVGWHPGRLQPHTLHVVKYVASNDSHRRLRKLADPRDTMRIALRRGQMDTLYALTTALFAQPGPHNLTPDHLPAPPEPDAISATVDFNLGPGGNRYKVHLPAAGQNFALHTYLKRVLAQYKRSHPPIT
ncbi:hypothetical protein [Hymenobacter cellulosivorans]|uniref:DUF4136 domain-containing protein n=1 Tax=Hymenobacter cellulosivorans TaxID=2932249 RepID=A0ABY4FF72_9BACT|nr:hypothetical protein [Hymenobacter cellulosivorans]UOQ55264.1 hypothetical protein MUN80_11010 [Hymenobacter cellulosivorans]